MWLLTLIVPPGALRVRLVNVLDEYTSAKMLITGVALCVQVPIAAQAPAEASKVTLVVDKALDKMAAALLSITIASGSVSQVPTLPLGAVVSTTKPLP